MIPEDPPAGAGDSAAAGDGPALDGLAARRPVASGVSGRQALLAIAFIFLVGVGIGIGIGLGL